VPTPLTTPPLEVVLQGLHASDIRCGIQNDPPAGGITAWIDFGSRTEKATFYGAIIGDQQIWPAADRIAAWMHETALRRFPYSPYAKAHSAEAPKKPTKDQRGREDGGSHHAQGL
jgi:hypothetical protein